MAYNHYDEYAIRTNKLLLLLLKDNQAQVQAQVLFSINRK